jgi:peroxiredoxin
MWAHLGDFEKAEKAAADAVKGGENRVGPLAVQVDVLMQAGKNDKAIKQFEALRKISAFIDLELPAMQRLKKVAAKQGWPEDWRLAHEAADDLGERPPLDSLGPFRWSPYVAPSWSMKDQDGKNVHLADYLGKPLVLIYYLGSGCKHCIEQLDAFSKVAARYERNGIPIVAVSRESVADLYKTRENVSDEEWFPFTVLSDEKLKNFKAYRAFDDFEDEALHGTFLIDGEGLVRWQHISFEPFMQPEFLLEEAQRLLAF